MSGMTEEEPPSSVTLVHEAHEMLLRQVESGSGKIRSLAMVTIIVASLLVVAYATQLAQSAMGVSVITVNLGDPLLIAFELLLLALAVAWLYVGFRDYRFTTKLARQVKEVRAAEAELMKRQGLDA